MSLRGKLGLGRHVQPEVEAKHEDIERREIAHQAIFAEIAELRDVCRFLLNGHPVPKEPLCDEDGTKYIICCISGTTTRVKIIHKKFVDDFSVNEHIFSRRRTEYDDDHNPQSTASFDITSSYMNGFTEEEMTEQLKALYDLQEKMLVAGRYITPGTLEDEEHYAA